MAERISVKWTDAMMIYDVDVDSDDDEDYNNDQYFPSNAEISLAKILGKTVE